MLISIIGEINEQLCDTVYNQIMNDYKVGDNVTVQISSNGGFLDCGFELYDMLDTLKQQGSIIYTENIGNVMSAATISYLVGNERTWNEKFGEFLIHNPYMEDIAGDKDKLLETALDLSVVENNLVDFYSAVTGNDKELIRILMKENAPLDKDFLLGLNFATGLVVEEIPL